MDLERAREKNQARQARFRRRHPRYHSDRQKLRRLRNPIYRNFSPVAGYRTYELADPRDENLLPRLIGYCKITTRPVWSALWVVKDVSNSRWAVWFRELAALGLTPVERFGWTLGTVMPINRFLARSLVCDRIKQISSLTTGNPRQSPPWLLQNIRVRGRSCPVGRMFPDGRIERFANIRTAIQVISGHRPSELLAHWAHIAGTGVDGCVWFED